MCSGSLSECPQRERSRYAAGGSVLAASPFETPFDLGEKHYDYKIFDITFSAGAGKVCC